MIELSRGSIHEQLSDKKHPESSHIPEVSVLLCSSNRPEKVRFCLQALARQTLSTEKFEVVCVNDGSTDGLTRDVMVEGLRGLPGRYLEHNTSMGLAAARNTALRSAKGHLVLFINDDTHPETDLIERHIVAHKNRADEHAAILGHIGFPSNHQNSVLSKAIHQFNLLFPLIGNVKDIAHGLDHFATGNLSVARSAFTKHRIEFDETFRHYGCEGIEVGYKLWSKGYRVYFHPEAKIIYDQRITIAEYIQREELNNFNLVQFLVKNPALISHYLSIPCFAGSHLQEWREQIKGSSAMIEELVERIEKIQDLPFLGSTSPNIPDYTQTNLIRDLGEALIVIRDHVKRKVILQNIERMPGLHDQLLKRQKQPSVSVIVHCLNSEKQLIETVESVLNQTFKDFEIIVIDNGGTDSLKETAEKLITSNPDQWIRLIDQSNSGHAGIARNRSISEVKGDYILCLDTGDMIAPSLLEESVALLNSNPEISIVYTDRVYLSDEGKPHIIPAVDWDFDRLPYENQVPACSLFRRKVWEDVGGYKSDMDLGDWDFWITAGEKNHRGKRIPRPLFYYRNHESGFHSDAIKQNERHRAQIVLNHPDLYDETTVRRAQRVLSNHPRGIQAAKHQLEERKPGFAFCIITDGRRPQKLRMLIESIHAQYIPNYQIIIAGVASGLELEGLQFIPMPKAARAGRLSMMRNTAAEESQYDNLVFCDDDILLTPDWFSGLRSGLQKYDLFSTTILNVDGTRFWDRASISPEVQKLLNYGETDPYVYLTGGFLVVKASAWAAIRWNERLGFYEAEDVDFSRRAQQLGLRLGCCQESIAIHNDPRYTQLGRYVFKRTEEGADVYLNGTLASATIPDLIQRALMEIRKKRYAEAIDCLRNVLLREPNHAQVGEFLHELEMAAGGPVDGGPWRQRPIIPESPLESKTPQQTSDLFLTSPTPVLRDSTVSEPPEVVVDQRNRISFAKKNSYQTADQNQASGIGNRASLIWEGSQFVYHSLAYINRELCLQLIDAGHEVSVIPYERHQFGPEVDSRFEKLAGCFGAPLSRNLDVHVRHQWPPNFTPPPAGHWVMIQPWEFGRLPEDWVRPMSDLVDEIWVPSKHVLKSYVASGIPVDRLQVVPNGVNTDMFHPGAEPYRLPTGKNFKFLFVGGTIWRKGVDLLLEAYRTSFRRSDDVVLVIKDMGQDSFYKGMGAAETIRDIQKDPEAPEILYLDQMIPEQDMPGLFTACDCLVHPYRGEGFGLPVLEAMACGIPVIVTMGGATDDFCPPQFTYHVPARLRDIALGDFHLVTGAGRILEPDLHELQKTLLHVHENLNEAKEKARQATELVRTRYNWENIAQQVMGRIQVLSEKPVRRSASF